MFSCTIEAQLQGVAQKQIQQGLRPLVVIEALLCAQGIQASFRSLNQPFQVVQGSGVGPHFVCFRQGHIVNHRTIQRLQAVAVHPLEDFRHDVSQVFAFVAKKLKGFLLPGIEQDRKQHGHDNAAGFHFIELHLRIFAKQRVVFHRGRMQPQNAEQLLVGIAGLANAIYFGEPGVGVLLHQQIKPVEGPEIPHRNVAVGKISARGQLIKPVYPSPEGGRRQNAIRLLPDPQGRNSPPSAHIPGKKTVGVANFLPGKYRGHFALHPVAQGAFPQGFVHVAGLGRVHGFAIGDKLRQLRRQAKGFCQPLSVAFQGIVRLVEVGWLAFEKKVERFVGIIQKAVAAVGSFGVVCRGTLRNDAEIFLRIEVVQEELLQFLAGFGFIAAASDANDKDPVEALPGLEFVKIDPKTHAAVHRSGKIDHPFQLFGPGNFSVFALQLLIRFGSRVDADLQRPAHRPADFCQFHHPTPVAHEHKAIRQQVHAGRVSPGIWPQLCLRLGGKFNNNNQQVHITAGQAPSGHLRKSLRRPQPDPSVAFFFSKRSQQGSIGSLLAGQVFGGDPHGLPIGEHGCRNRLCGWQAKENIFRIVFDRFAGLVGG